MKLVVFLYTNDKQMLRNQENNLIHNMRVSWGWGEGEGWRVGESKRKCKNEQVPWNKTNQGSDILEMKDLYNEKVIKRNRGRY